MKYILSILLLTFTFSVFPMVRAPKTNPRRLALQSQLNRKYSKNSFDPSFCRCTDYAQHGCGLQKCKTEIDCKERLLKGLALFKRVRTKYLQNDEWSSVMEEWQNTIEVAGCKSNEITLRQIIHAEGFFKDEKVLEKICTRLAAELKHKKIKIK